MDTDLGHWTYDGEISPEPYGFIYEITNMVSNKKYIGKKQMTSTRKLAPLKGKKNKRHRVIETDWKTYTGSSNELNSDIETYGKEKFKFEILQFCNSKSELSYREAKLQFEKDVLLKEEFYNGIINCRIGKIKLTS